jgi:small subunit ribosomal protein S20
MPNIKQQKKRVRSAARQRLENLRYRSTVKTLTRRLEEAATAGESDRVQSEHRELVRWIDRAAARGALHRNTAARRKARAARIAGPGAAAPEPAAKPRRLGRR